MRVYEFECDPGVCISIKVNCDNEVSLTVRNICKQFRHFLESPTFFDIAEFQSFRIVFMRLVRFFKKVFKDEKEYECGTEEIIKKNIKDDYPLLYGCIEGYCF